MRNYLAEQERFPDGKLSYRVRKGSLIRNYLTEQEKYKFHYLRSNSYLAEQEKSSIHVIGHL
jgi:hypothetical protein